MKKKIQNPPLSSLSETKSPSLPSLSSFFSETASRTKNEPMSLPSSNLRLLQCFCAILWCFFAAGPIFGFAALKPILISEGIYHDACNVGTQLQGDLCVAQDLKLNKMFTVGAVVTNVCALAVGSVLDNFGPRVCGFIGSVLIAIGTLFMSGSLSFLHLLDPYLSGYVFLALGGPFVFISSFQLANSFPKYSGMILALLTGAFDTSSAVFLVYRITYQNYVRISLHTFFLGFLIVPTFIFLCQLFIMPSEGYKTVGAVRKLQIEGLDENGQLLEGDDGSHLIPDADERTSLLSANERQNSFTSFTADHSRRKSVYEEYVEHEITSKSGNIFGIMDGQPISKQLKSPYFWIMGAFTTIQMIRINYFVATIRSQENFLLGEELGLKINNVFDIVLPIGGVVAIPFIGLILDNFKTIQVLGILLVVSFTIGVFGLFHSFYLNLIGILLLVTYRPFYYTAVSDYCAKVFGFTTFGTVYGLMMCISGVFNYSQTFLDKITKKQMKGNPTPVNIFLITLSVFLGSSLILFILQQSKSIDRKKLENEAESAPIRDIPQ